MKQKRLFILVVVFTTVIGIQIGNISGNSSPRDLVFAEQPGDYTLTTATCIQETPDGICGNTIECCIEGGNTSCMSQLCRAHCTTEERCTSSPPPPSEL